MKGQDFGSRAEAMLHTILETICEDDYPATAEAIRDGFDFEAEPAEIARMLMDADPGMPKPRCVSDYLLFVLGHEAENGSADAMNDLGVLYYDGRSGEQSYEKAVQWYRKAAEHGSMVALENLGYCYYYGRSIPVDDEQAFLCFGKCALAGMHNSLYKLADMYRYGRFVAKDERLAWLLYRRTLEELYESEYPLIGADVFRRMGDCLFEGIGTEADPEQALEMYQNAERWFYVKLKNGDPFARTGLEHVLARQDECRKAIEGELPL